MGKQAFSNTRCTLVKKLGMQRDDAAAVKFSWVMLDGKTIRRLLVLENF
jgi:hypothetical protein